MAGWHRWKVFICESISRSERKILDVVDEKIEQRSERLVGTMREAVDHVADGTQAETAILRNELSTLRDEARALRALFNAERRSVAPLDLPAVRDLH